MEAITNSDTTREIKFVNKGLGENMRILFILRKERGVAVLTTTLSFNGDEYSREFDALTLDYHSKTERPTLTSSTEKCEYLEGNPCWHDGSGLAANEAWDAMERSGESGLWSELEEFHEYMAYD